MNQYILKEGNRVEHLLARSLFLRFHRFNWLSVVVTWMKEKEKISEKQKKIMLYVGV